MTELWSVKKCREKGCGDLGKVENINGDRCLIFNTMPGNLPCCIKDPIIRPEVFLHNMPLLITKAGQRGHSYYQRKNPGPKNCPKMCPYRVITDGEKVIKNDKGLYDKTITVKLPACAFSGKELRDAGICRTTILDAAPEDQQHQIDEISLSIRRFQHQPKPSPLHCGQGCCPDGVTRCMGDIDACPLIKVPFADLKECPIFRIPAERLPAPEKTGLSEKEKPTKMLQVKKEGNPAPASVERSQDTHPIKKERKKPALKPEPAEPVQPLASEPDPITHLGVDGLSCSGDLVPVWRRGRWLDICELCGYQEVPNKARLKAIDEMVEAGTIERPPTDRSRQSALYSFRSGPVEDITPQPRPVECKAKDLPVDECQEKCDYRPRCRYRYSTENCREEIGIELRRTKDTPEWFAALTEAKRHNNPGWKWEVWKNVPEKGNWLYEGAEKYDDASAICEQLTGELPKGSKTMFSILGRPAPDYATDSIEGPCRNCKIECLDDNDGCWEFELHSCKLDSDSAPERWGYREICIISCGKAKIWDDPQEKKVKCARWAKVAARDAYTGPLFSAARKYAEHEFHGDEYYILSDKYGLISPGTEIENYDVSPEEIEHDADFFDMVQQQAKANPDLAILKKITILCGAIHQKIIERAFRGVEITNPVQDLPQGKRMKALKELVDPPAPKAVPGGPQPSTCGTCGHHKGRT